MVVVYLRHNGRRGVKNFTPKRKGEAWRRSKLNILASFNSWKEYHESQIAEDIKTYQHR